ncbi:peroxisomal ABC transporter 1 [Striga asiatica]|uniref:Peroxisomal ABC transporter 1 n=1 Tax=Striga asiatica TaxID=4170 RepID=A0A5A7QCK9_STRAF|nr:peroxisomal ABC transporter 1 [Striga asiatica]
MVTHRVFLSHHPTPPSPAGSIPTTSSQKEKKKKNRKHKLVRRLVSAVSTPHLRQQARIFVSVHQRIGRRERGRATAEAGLLAEELPGQVADGAEMLVMRVCGSGNDGLVRFRVVAGSALMAGGGQWISGGGSAEGLLRMRCLSRIWLALEDIGRFLGDRLLVLGCFWLVFGGDEYFMVNLFGICSNLALLVDFHPFDISFNAFPVVMWFEIVAIRSKFRVD